MRWLDGFWFDFAYALVIIIDTVWRSDLFRRETVNCVFDHRGTVYYCCAMGVELELLVLLALSVIGQSIFARFEIETPAWRKILKWLVVIAVTLSLYYAIGHWALIFPILLGAAGLTFHFGWCRRHGIDPVRATPQRTYYQLRGWQWHE